jgi:L-lactate dehydrogenase complex protein LldG
MSSAREVILSRVRRSLRRTAPLEPSVSSALAARMTAHPVHAQPRVSEALVERFAAKLQAAGATLAKVPDLAAVPDAVQAHLKGAGAPPHLHGAGAPPRLVVSADPLVGAMRWPAGVAAETRAARDGDAASVTGALVGVAETGTLALLSSPESPTTLNFLPEAHIVVLRRAQIVCHLEDVWSALRSLGPGMPRTVNLISGPSKTADVEQTLQTGAHGPRRLHVILVEETGKTGEATTGAQRSTQRKPAKKRSKRTAGVDA